MDAVITSLSIPENYNKIKVLIFCLPLSLNNLIYIYIYIYIHLQYFSWKQVRYLLIIHILKYHSQSGPYLVFVLTSPNSKAWIPFISVCVYLRHIFRVLSSSTFFFFFFFLFLGMKKKMWIYIGGYIDRRFDYEIYIGVSLVVTNFNHYQ